MILDSKLVEEIIKENYSLGKIISINPLESGHQSDNVKVTTEKGEYVVKYFPQESASLVESMILQDLLFSKGVKLPQPIKTVSNDFFVEFSETETIAIQSFIRGEDIVDRDNDPEKMYSLMSWFGKHIGEFHCLSSSIDKAELRKRIKRKDFFDLSGGTNWIKEQYDNADTILPDHPMNDKILEEFETYLKEIDALYKSNLSLGIIHTDLKPGDFFVENGELTGILDFSGAFYSFIISELGTWIMYTSLYKPENKIHFETFIKSYLESSKIPMHELKFIPVFLKGRAFVQFFYFAYRIHNNITQGLGEGETNFEGFEHGIELVETATKIESTYFFDLAQQTLDR
jgi:Ser/Thr protein kinase RdoA (MazF antagonist)